MWKVIVWSCIIIFGLLAGFLLMKAFIGSFDQPSNQQLKQQKSVIERWRDK